MSKVRRSSLSPPPPQHHIHFRLILLFFGPHAETRILLWDVVLNDIAVKWPAVLAGARAASRAQCLLCLPWALLGSPPPSSQDPPLPSFPPQRKSASTQQLMHTHTHTHHKPHVQTLSLIHQNYICTCTSQAPHTQMHRASLQWD
jgi:hypothetical protein